MPLTGKSKVIGVIKIGDTLNDIRIHFPTVIDPRKRLAEQVLLSTFTI